MCYGICTAESDDGAEDMELMKREGFTDEEEEEGEEEEQQQLMAGTENTEDNGEKIQQKNPSEKKVD